MTPECTTRQSDFRGWQACFLENGYVRLVAVPSIGGRLMAYNLGEYPFFFVDPDLAGKLFTPAENQGDGTLASWKNYGGDKTWPAPQGWDTDEQWHGPPDPVLDTGRYLLSEMSSDGASAVVRMVSPADTRTGVQITREFTLRQGSSRVVLKITFTNVKDKPIRWSIWDVAQLRAERRDSSGQLTCEPACVITTPLNPRSKFPRGFNVMFGAEDNPQWQTDPQRGLFKASYQWQIGKVGVDTPAGWIAFNNGAAGYAFTERFAHEPGSEYPDSGATVEVWTVGAGKVANLNYENSQIYLMETEVLSPLRTITPGASTSFTIEWAACRCYGPVIDVTDAGCTVEPLAAVSSGEFINLTGHFGVFDAGELQMIWLNGGDQPVSQQSLGAVDPLTVLRLDRVARRPADAQQVILVVGSRRLAAARVE